MTTYHLRGLGLLSTLERGSALARLAVYRALRRHRGDLVEAALELQLEPGALAGLCLGCPILGGALEEARGHAVPN